MQPNLVSVNITTYNRCELLKKCILSVVEQSYTSLEIIVIDDCSSDETESTVKALSAKDKRIKYVRHDKNCGNAAARNTALRQGSGEFVAFMDDDDLWIDEDKLTKQVKIFRKNHTNNNLGLVCSSVNIYTDESTFTSRILKEPSNIRRHILCRNSLIYNSSVLTKRSIINDIGGFDESLPRGIDSDFFRAAILKGYNVKFMPDITVAVREFGIDRITPKNSATALNRENKAILAALNKYINAYKADRISFAFRKKQLIKNSIKIALLEKSVRPLLKIPSFLFL